MSTTSIDGHRYFFTIVDDKSRYTWLFPMKSKYDTRSLIQNFFTMIETQFATKIKTIQTDNGFEFLFHDFFTSKGIIHQTSCPYTSQ